jgi:hypothetical protein
MVKAILDGRKSQTRRVVKRTVLESLTQFTPEYIASSDHCFSPYGQPGDRLWVKEAWRAPASLDDMSPSQIADQCLDTGYCKPWTPIEYIADGKRNNTAWWAEWGARTADRRSGRYRHARFMPRWASRIALEVTGVRVEHLQDVSVDDCYAEGIDPRTPRDLARNAYEDVWAGTTGDWSINPWVWVIEFKRIEL